MLVDGLYRIACHDLPGHFKLSYRLLFRSCTSMSTSVYFVSFLLLSDNLSTFVSSASSCRRWVWIEYSYYFYLFDVIAAHTPSIRAYYLCLTMKLLINIVSCISIFSLRCNGISSTDYRIPAPHHLAVDTLSSQRYIVERAESKHVRSFVSWLG